MILKKAVIDKLVISNFVKNVFNPDYDYYYSDIVRFEFPWKCN